MTNWEEQFAPLKDALNLSVRKEQAHFADAVIDVMDAPVGTQHICAEAGTGTGKSFAYLVPLIHKVKSGSDIRGVISTETLTLQDQIAYKDLPLLQKVYKGFSYMSLKGRSNYLCIARANAEAGAHPEVLEYLSDIEAKNGQFTEATQDEVTSVLHEKIPDDVWRYMCGEADFCSECDATDGLCYGSIARSKVGQHDIIVTNHALMQSNAAMGGDLLGDLQYVIIDEAHTLEDVFINSLQVDISGWEIVKMTRAIADACAVAGPIMFDDSLSGAGEVVRRDMNFVLDSIITFYSILEKDGWDKAEGIMRERMVFRSAGPVATQAMNVMEKDVPVRIETMERYLKSLTDQLVKAKDVLRAGGSKAPGGRKIGKGITAINTLRKVTKMISGTVSSKDGIIDDFGIPYVVEYRGYIDKENSKRINISFVPIDVSKQMSEGLWEFDAVQGVAQKTCIIVSATLTDITDGSFRFARSSVGFPAAGVREMTIGSPFNYDEQQLIYTTPGTYDPIPVERAQFSLDEAVNLIKAAGGRSLLLFTAKAELEYAAEHIRTMNLPYAVYVQGEGMSKKELSDEFMSDESSVLLATKSFFTGVNFSGDSCSMVILCKFPLKRFTGVCQAQIAHWRKRGFPEWYEMQALTVFRQAAGRLIRSEKDRGVVAIIDKRVSNPKERVFHTASMGISTLGSIVTNSMEDIDEFFGN